MAINIAAQASALIHKTINRTGLLGERKGIAKEDAVSHLSKRFKIPAEDLSYEFEQGAPGWRLGKPERADTLSITVRQPSNQPNLHQDMHEELRQMFSLHYGKDAFNPKSMLFYFGVHEDKAFREEQNARRSAQKATAAQEGLFPTAIDTPTL